MPEFDGTPHSVEQFLSIPWLWYEIHRSGLDGSYRLFGIDISGDEQHHAPWVVLQYACEPFISLLAADGIAMEVHVEYDDIGMERIHKLDDTLRIGRHSHCLHVWLEQHVERKKYILVVIDNEDSSFFIFYIYVSHLIYSLNRSFMPPMLPMRLVAS